MKECDLCCGATDIGTVIDNSDCGVDFEQVYATEGEAEDALAYLTSKARATESEPCKIESRIEAVDGGYKLTANFEFAYQVETMIFQLSTR